MSSLKQFVRLPFYFSVLLLCSVTAMAQTKAPAKPATATTSTDAAKAAAAPVAAKGAQSYIDGFFKRYKTSPDSAVDYIFGTNKLFARNAAQINVLKMKLDSMQTSIGKYTGKELIMQRSAAPSLVIYSYLVKHENQPVRFTFIFYKAQNDWALYRFNYDDQMDTEMFETVKISNKR